METAVDKPNPKNIQAVLAFCFLTTIQAALRPRTTHFGGNILQETRQRNKTYSSLQNGSGTQGPREWMLIFPQNIYLGQDRVKSLLTNGSNFARQEKKKKVKVEMLAK